MSVRAFSAVCLLVLFLATAPALADEKREDVSLRDMYSRHYVLPDGMRQAEISTGPIHYRGAGGRWLPIDTALIAVEGERGPELANETNVLRSHFAAGSIRLSAGDGEEVVLAPRGLASWKNGRRVIAPNAAFMTVPQLHEDGASVEYERVWGPGMRSRFEVAPAQVRASIILEMPPVDQTRTQPETFEYEFDLILPEGHSLRVGGEGVGERLTTKSPIEVVTATGMVAMVLAPPSATDSRGDLDPAAAHTLQRMDSGWRLSVGIAAPWLLDPGRAFPVSVNAAVGPLSDAFTGYLCRTCPADSSASSSQGAIVDADDFSGWVNWDIRSVPSDARVTQAALTLQLTDFNNNCLGGNFRINDFARNQALTPGPYGAYTAAVWTELADGLYWEESNPAVQAYPYSFGMTLGGLHAAVQDLQAQLSDGWFQIGLSSAVNGCIMNFGGCFDSTDCTDKDHTLTVTYTINHPPVFAPVSPDFPIPPLNDTVAERSPDWVRWFSGSDPDAGDSLTISLVASSLDEPIPAGLQLVQEYPLSPLRYRLSWCPSEAQGPGTYHFKVRVSDGLAWTDREMTVTVTESNVAPVLNGVPETTAENPWRLVEGSAYAFDADATDEDITYGDTHQSLTLSASGVPSGATFDTGTGSFAWTPAPGTAGNYTVRVGVSDGLTLVNDDVHIKVVPPNTPPVLTGVPASATIPELFPYTFDANATDSDLPAQTLTFSLVGAPAGAAIDSTGVFTWTPTEEQGGTGSPYSFTVRVSDGTANTSQLVTLTVTEDNTWPVLTVSPTQFWWGEMCPFSVTASGSDADLPAQTLTYSIASGGPAGATIDSSGLVQWTPSEEQGPGSYTLTVRLSDGTGTVEQPITIHVIEDNRPPVMAGSWPAEIELTEHAWFERMVEATDPDIPAQRLTFSLVASDTALPDGLMIYSHSSQSAALWWMPTEADGGKSYSFRIQVRDEDYASASEVMTLKVAEANAAPALQDVPASATIPETEPWTFTAVASDGDTPPQTVTFSLVGAPAGAEIGPSSGIFTWTPSEAQGPGTYAFTVQVSDGFLATTSPITITVSDVNTPPQLSGVPATLNINELETGGFTALATDSDLPAQTLTFTLVNAPAGATIGASSGVFSWTPSEGQGGDSVLTVTVSDGSANSEQQVTIHVAEINAAPQFTTAPPVTGESDEHVPVTFTVAAADADLPAQTLAFSLVGAPAGATIDASTGAFSWTPSETQGGASYDFQVAVSDGSVTTDANVHWSVTETNAPPVLSGVNANATIDELVLWTFDAGVTDPDVPEQALTFSLAGAPEGASIGPSTGVFTWIPTDAQGPHTGYSFTIVVSDGLTTASQAVTVDVNEVNAAPVLTGVDASQTVSELTPASFTAAATDEDAKAHEVWLTFFLTGTDGHSVPEGAEIDSYTGHFSWTPTEEQGAGTYPFNVCVSDGVDTTTQAVTITVNEVNLAPVPSGIPTAPAIPENVAYSFDAAATDGDCPPHSQALAFSLIDAPSGASISAAGHFAWTPTEAQGPGTFPFTVRVSDGVADVDTPLTISVAETNSAPVLAAIGSKSVTWGVPLTFTAAASDSDLPANNLTYSLTGAATGMTIDASSGQFSWTPGSAQIGPHSVTVTVSDGSATDQETIDIVVGKRNSAIACEGLPGAQYSDLAGLAASLYDPLNSAGIAGETLRFTVGSQVVDGVTNVSGFATSSGLTIDQSPGAYTVHVSFAGSALYVASTQTQAYTVVPEDALADYAGAVYASTACATCSTGVVTLAATIRDITAVAGNPDTHGGDISNATVTFVKFDGAVETDIATVPVVLIGSAGTLTGVATHDWEVDIGSALDEEFDIGIRIGGSYTARLELETVVTVVKPLSNFISGAGYVLISGSEGDLAADDGSKTNFGFGLRTNKSGKNLQGRINTIFRVTDDDGVLRTYQAKATALTSLAVNQEAGTAAFTAKAVIQERTHPLSPEGVDANATLQIAITDRGEPGTADSIAITIWKRKGGLWFSSAWNGTRTVETAIETGNINVH
jgi:hypothetical protein